MIKDMIKKFNNNFKVLDHGFIVDTFIKDKLLNLVGITNWIQSEVLIINKAYGLDEYPMLRNQSGQDQCITLVRGKGIEFIYDRDAKEIERVELNVGDSLYLPSHLYHGFLAFKDSVISIMSTDYNNPDKEQLISLEDINICPNN